METNENILERGDAQNAIKIKDNISTDVLKTERVTEKKSTISNEQICSPGYK